ncbi:hypothetical protein [Gelidibacter salicanalis]|uniref:Uncharacterized protein n=1 Tax=Gelidibacter salicanalis TaxID=291193 RepID=A0A934KQI2_9FLAO|nr:hypothetical protein [Gelidibacter salicanalis]MBJ7880265.1 hypothetical protein [Gelidibacter salicanalis]
MKQVKWEDNIKQVLEKRVMTPSDASWGALSERLDASEKHSIKPMFWWIGIAASVTTLLFITTLFFNGNTPDLQNQIVVETQEQVDEQSLKMEQAPQEHQLVERNEKSDTAAQVEKNDVTKQPIKSQDIITSAKQQRTEIVKNNQVAPVSPMVPNSEMETLENIKITEIVAQIQDLTSKGETVTDADIEALLVKAQKEMNYQSAIRESNYAVDANALLRDVETDLQESFRNKIFEALKNSYETLRTAVAERHN